MTSLLRPKVKSVLRRMGVAPDVQNASFKGGDLRVTLRGGGFKTLVARPRGSDVALRLDPDLALSSPISTTYRIPIAHLLPRSVAQATVDLYREQRGVERRLRFPPRLRPEPGRVDGMTAWAFATAQGNLSVSVLRQGRRPPLRVVVVLHQLNFTGGKTTMLFRLSSLLRSAGFDVTLTSFWLTSTPMVYQPPEDVGLDYMDAQMLQPPGEKSFYLVMPEFSASERTVGRIRDYFANIPADVVYFPDYDSELYEIALDALPERVLSILGDHNGGRYGGALSKGTVPRTSERDAMFHRAMQRFDAIHTVNPAVVRAYEASTAKPVFCITNSVAVPGGQPADYLAHRRIIAAGRHAPAKNFDVLLRAFAIVRESFPEWTLDIFGKGELTDELAALRVQLGLEDAVTLRDPTPNLLDEMRASAFHVSSSRAESFGLTMAEAMSVGLPVLSHRRNAGAAYLLADGRGFIARSNDVESLVEAMEDMIRRIESGDADGTLARTVASGMAFVRRISSDAVIASWKSEINRLYDRKIERLYA